MVVFYLFLDTNFDISKGFIARHEKYLELSKIRWDKGGTPEGLLIKRVMWEDSDYHMNHITSGPRDVDMG